MIGKSIRFNRRNAMSFLLVVVMLTLATTPALAWFDEGDGNGQVVRSCHVISDSRAASTAYCYQVMPHQVRPIAEKPLVRPSIAKAELFNRVSPDPLVQASTAQ